LDQGVGSGVPLSRKVAAVFQRRKARSSMARCIWTPIPAAS
jgi:hypothetical protein